MTDSGVLRPTRAVSLSALPPIPFGKEQYPIEFVEANAAIKMREADDVVVVGVVAESDPMFLESLRDFHDKPVEFVQIDRTELAGYLSRELAGSDDQSSVSGDGGHTVDEIANDAPIVNLVNGILLEGIRRGASDIHIEAQKTLGAVRYRMDGVLSLGKPFALERFPAVSSRIKIMSRLNILERRLPQDGRVTISIGGDSVDLRVSVVPTSTGESIVLRLFNRADDLLQLDELGYTEEGADVLRGFARFSHGLVLVTGPTGSGKTTTLNAILRELDRESQKVVTIEDPVEYLIDNVDQIQTNDTIGLSFHNLLRRVLRQDPDVIMVGEIRDLETAELAVRAAMTGHLVFSTLHTNDAASAITRLSDMGVKPYLTASVLRVTVAQRLVRRLCPACAASRATDPMEQELFRKSGVSAGRVPVAAGCDECGRTGYRGRTTIHELIQNDAALEQLVVRAVSSEVITDHLLRSGWRSMRADGLAKVALGETTIAEVMRAVQ